VSFVGRTQEELTAAECPRGGIANDREIARGDIIGRLEPTLAPRDRRGPGRPPHRLRAVEVLLLGCYARHESPIPGAYPAILLVQRPHARGTGEPQPRDGDGRGGRLRRS